MGLANSPSIEPCWCHINAHAQ